MNKSDEELLKKFKEQRAKQYARQAAYAAKSYDRIIITMPKGRKSEIDAHAKACGFKSTNAYLNHLVEQDMQIENDVRGKANEELK